MGFLRRDDRPRDARMSATTALVIEAPAPPEGGPRVGPGSGLPIKVLADFGSGKMVHDCKVRLSESHWLVPGMDVRVTFDPGRQDAFEIDWDSVPSMEARAAANDAALADPIAARRRVAHALGMTKADTGTARTERFERAVEEARSRSAPPGRVRAVALIATIRGRRRIVGDADNVATHDAVTYARKSAAVLSVTVPGRGPYAVYVPAFKCEVDLLEPMWMPLPALVSTIDRADVEILWDEVPSHQAQLADRISGSLATKQARSFAADPLGAAQAAAASASGAGADPLGAARAAAAPGAAADPLAAAQAAAAPAAMASQMQALAAENAKRALQYVSDPSMRKMLIDQYRAAGIEIDQDR
jgi:hypothetical protein